MKEGNYHEEKVKSQERDVKCHNKSKNKTIRVETVIVIVTLSITFIILTILYVKFNVKALTVLSLLASVFTLIIEDMVTSSYAYINRIARRKSEIVREHLLYKLAFTFMFLSLILLIVGAVFPNVGNKGIETIRAKSIIHNENVGKLSEFEDYVVDNKDYIENIVSKAGRFVYPVNFVSRTYSMQYIVTDEIKLERPIISNICFSLTGEDEVLDKEGLADFSKLKKDLQSEGLYLHFVQSFNVIDELRSSVKEIELFENLDESMERNYHNYLVILNYP